MREFLSPDAAPAPEQQQSPRSGHHPKTDPMGMQL
jgi:hypothetical protein